MTTTNWALRPVPVAMTPERLGAFIEGEVKRSESMLFSVTPREALDAIGRSQQLMDQAFAQQIRAIVAAHTWSAKDERDFAADEVALALGVGMVTAGRLLDQAVGLASLPGMVEALEAGWLTQRHALAVLRELDEVELSTEQRIGVATIVLARLTTETPHELRKMTRRLILTIDLPAARGRQDVADKKRNVGIWGGSNGQGSCLGTGPLVQIEAIRASMARWLTEHPKAPDDPRTEGEREFDLFVALLTGGTEAGSWQASIVTPFSTATGGELELAEIPGLGPILPSTARDLLADAEWTQVAVDQDGVVIAVGTPVPAPTPTSAPPTPTGSGPAGASAGVSARANVNRTRENWELSLAQLMSTPPKARLMPDQLSSAAYTTPARLRRFLQARDRTCVFPGCHRRIADVDHRIPWPLGATAAENLQLLCRHHHRGKQAVFTVELTDDGAYLWTTRGGWQFLRHRQGY